MTSYRNLLTDYSPLQVVVQARQNHKGWERDENPSNGSHDKPCFFSGLFPCTTHTQKVRDSRRLRLAWNTAAKSRQSAQLRTGLAPSTRAGNTRMVRERFARDSRTSRPGHSGPTRATRRQPKTTIGRHTPATAHSDTPVSDTPALRPPQRIHDRCHSSPFVARKKARRGKRRAVGLNAGGRTGRNRRTGRVGRNSAARYFARNVPAASSARKLA
jgi:hypothetical protein